MKIRLIGLVLSLISLITSLVALSSCKKGDLPFQISEWEKEARDATVGMGFGARENDFLKHKYTTPRGMKVYSVVEVPSEFLVHADTGVQRQIDRLSTMFPEWGAWRQHSDYRLILLNPNGSPPCITEENSPGAPCLWICPGFGCVKAAGAMIGHDDRWSDLDQYPAMILPHQVAQNWTYQDWFIETVHNEAEHVRGWKNRVNNPSGVFYHFIGANDIHPWTWGTGLTADTTPKQVDIIHEVK